jgi:hypothetical protein
MSARITERRFTRRTGSWRGVTPHRECEDGRASPVWHACLPMRCARVDPRPSPWRPAADLTLSRVQSASPGAVQLSAGSSRVGRHLVSWIRKQYSRTSAGRGSACDR